MVMRRKHNRIVSAERSESGNSVSAGISPSNVVVYFLTTGGDNEVELQQCNKPIEEVVEEDSPDVASSKEKMARLAEQERQRKEAAKGKEKSQ